MFASMLPRLKIPQKSPPQSPQAQTQQQPQQPQQPQDKSTLLGLYSCKNVPNQIRANTEVKFFIEENVPSYSPYKQILEKIKNEIGTNETKYFLYQLQQLSRDPKYSPTFKEMMKIKIETMISSICESGCIEPVVIQNALGWFKTATSWTSWLGIEKIKKFEGMIKKLKAIGGLMDCNLLSRVVNQTCELAFDFLQGEFNIQVIPEYKEKINAMLYVLMSADSGMQVCVRKGGKMTHKVRHHKIRYSKHKRTVRHR